MIAAEDKTGLTMTKGLLFSALVIAVLVLANTSDGLPSSFFGKNNGNGCSSPVTDGQGEVTVSEFLSLIANPVNVLYLLYDGILGQGQRSRKKDGTTGQPRYAILIDAGSSGSSVAIYSWTPNCAVPSQLLNITALTNPANGEEINMEIKPGLSSNDQNPALASNYIDPLLKFAAQQIPVKEHSQAELYILATGGMRLLPVEKQKAILDDLLADIPKKYKFRLGPDSVKIITGKEEGLYAWMATNYMSNRLNGKNETTGQRDLTIGIIEMGGASAQIAFEITDPSELQEIVRLSGAKSEKDVQQFLFDLDLGTTARDERIKYRLYSRSFLGLGADSARLTYLSQLIIGSVAYSDLKAKASEPGPKSISVSDPCLTRGSTSKAEYLDANNSVVHVDLRGMGSFEVCNFLLKSLAEETSLLRPCSTDNTNCELKELKETGVAFRHGSEFDGLGGVFSSFREMIQRHGSFNYKRLVNDVAAQCQGSGQSNTRKRQAIVRANESIQSLLCFKRTWILTFLRDGLLMPNKFSHLNILKQNDGKNAAWPLGALLFKTRSLPGN